MSDKAAQDASLINQTPAKDASQINQTPPQAPIKFAPHQYFGVTKPVIPDPEKEPSAIVKKLPHHFFFLNEPVIPTPIPTMFHIASFNTLRRQLMYNNRIREDEPYLRKQKCQPLSEYNGALIGAVNRALYFLKEEKMIPTKENIHNFLRYDGDVPNDRNIDVEEALNHAIEHDEILMQNLGERRLYIWRYHYLWDCVNPEGGHPDQYSEATWDAVQKFLSSLHGSVDMKRSGSRYEAALVLKKSCLRRLCLGRVIQILNMVIAKGWIKPWVGYSGLPGWQPINITLA